MWLDMILAVYCNVICTGLPLGLFSTDVFWKRNCFVVDCSLMFQELHVVICQCRRHVFSRRYFRYSIYTVTARVVLI